VFIAPLAQIKSLETRFFPCPFLHGQDGHADGPGDIVVFRDNDLFIQILFEGSHHSLIEGGPALKEDPVSDAPVPDDPVEIILNNRITEPGNQIILLGPLLL